MAFDERVLEFGRIRELIASQCVSGLGRRRVAEVQPRTAREEIEREMELVREMMTLLGKRREPPIYGLRDVAEHVRRVARERAVLEPLELLDIREFLETARYLRNFFEAEVQDAPRLAELAQSLEALPALQRSIDEKIAPDGTVRDTASEALRELRRDIFACEQRIQTVLHRLIRDLTDSGDLQDSFFTLRNNRYVLPVKTSNRSRVPGLIHDSSNTGETVFIEPYAILEDSNRLSELRVKEREEIYRILLRVAGHMRDELSVLQTNLVILSELDYIFGRARFGVLHGCTFPHLQEPGRPLRLVEAHHPLLRVAAPAQSRPLTLLLEPENKVLVITGPNAGGKTTALKTIGLTVMMTQCAIPTPLSPHSVVPIFSDVLADIGDEQSVLEGMSTFSAHMQRIAAMLRGIGRASLVLLDELGTATDPAEGGALAVAIVERLAASAGLTVVSTHLTALKNWAADHPAGRNASFRLSQTERRPTFELILDLPGISEALIIAEQVGLPAEIIERARALRPQVEHEATALLRSLQAREEHLQRELAELARRREELDVERTMLEAERKELEETRRRLKKDMLAEKERALEEAKAQVEALIARQPSKQELNAARVNLEAEIKTTRAERESTGQEVTIDTAKLVKGQWVRVRNMSDLGVIEAVDSNRERLTVAMNGKRLEIRYRDVEGFEAGPAEGDGGGFTLKHTTSFDVSIDLHGMRVEVALDALDKFLDQAIVHGAPYVRVIHGHGMGVLRKAVREHLRGHPCVRSFRPGLSNEGGEAVTMVDLAGGD
jgi:DNA mismatch repair protein MutS2